MALLLSIAVLASLSTSLALFREVMFITMTSKVNKYENIVSCTIGLKHSSSIRCVGTTVFSIRFAINFLNNNPLIRTEDLHKPPRSKACRNGGHFKDQTKTSCECFESYTGTYCESYWHDCADGFKLGLLGESGYTIQPRSFEKEFRVNCRHRKDGGTAIQMQESGINFYRNWQEYRDGFGDPEFDHWLGLEKIRAIIDNSYSEMSLVIHLHYSKRSTKCHRKYYIFYRGFTVGNEAEGYRMNFSRVQIGINKHRKLHLHDEMNETYHIFDCLSELRGARFSTYDRDNDDKPDGNCAKIHHSGWWFKNCASCNPNGKLSKDDQPISPVSLYWPEKTCSIKRISMFLSPEFIIDDLLDTGF